MAPLLGKGEGWAAVASEHQLGKGEGRGWAADSALDGGFGGAGRRIFGVFVVHKSTMERHVARPVVLCMLFVHSSTGLGSQAGLDALSTMIRGLDAPFGTDW